jgi:hypothetical protein
MLEVPINQTTNPLFCPSLWSKTERHIRFNLFSIKLSFRMRYQLSFALSSMLAALSSALPTEVESGLQPRQTPTGNVIMTCKYLTHPKWAHCCPLLTIFSLWHYHPSRYCTRRRCIWQLFPGLCHQRSMRYNTYRYQRLQSMGQRH